MVSVFVSVPWIPSTRLESIPGCEWKSNVVERTTGTGQRNLNAGQYDRGRGYACGLLAKPPHFGIIPTAHIHPIRSYAPLLLFEIDHSRPSRLSRATTGHSHLLLSNSTICGCCRLQVYFSEGNKCGAWLGA